MKIYKLDIDVAKPINKMVAMQQNTTGMLVVTVTKDGGYIRNATCSVYDGENEITPYYIEDNHYWFKVDVGIQKKNLTVKFNATPITSTRETVINIGTGAGGMTKALNCVEFPEGTYNQDEFLPLAKKFGNSDGFPVSLYTSAGTQANVNFKYITIKSWHPDESERVRFKDSNNKFIPTDVPIVATGDVVVCSTVVVKRKGAEYGEEDYPSVGYYADYSLDTVIVPSKNADCFGEGDFPEPDEPVDSTDSELDSTDTEVDGLVG